MRNSPYYSFLVLITSILLSTSPLLANNVQVSNVSFNASTSELTFDIAWENSWTFTGSIRDAIWIFVKQAPLSGPQWMHVDIDAVTPPSNLFGFVGSDSSGVFVRRKFIGTGNISASTLKLTLLGLVGPYQDFKVFAIEMVNIPTGPYTLGDGVSPGRFHEGSDTNSTFQVNSAGAITMGTSSGQLNTIANLIGVPPDIPATFANGYDGFICMKYEISQQQYVDFLNCLTRVQQQSRTAADLATSNLILNYVMVNSGSPANRNGIRCDTGNIGTGPVEFFCDLNPANPPNSLDDGQHLAANYLNQADLYAYLDWACLRPMSMLEYEKICRGPMTPVPGEYAWGSAALTDPSNIAAGAGTATETLDNVGSEGPYGNGFYGLVTRCGFAANDTSDRVLSGAGFFGVMELTGNVWEVTSFDVNWDREVYGDGMLTADGNSDMAPSPTYFGRRGVPALPSLNTNTVSTLSLPNGTTSGSSFRGGYTGGRGVRKL